MPAIAGGEQPHDAKAQSKAERQFMTLRFVQSANGMEWSDSDVHGAKVNKNNETPKKNNILMKKCLISLHLPFAANKTAFIGNDKTWKQELFQNLRADTSLGKSSLNNVTRMQRVSSSHSMPVVECDGVPSF